MKIGKQIGKIKLIPIYFNISPSFIIKQTIIVQYNSPNNTNIYPWIGLLLSVQTFFILTIYDAFSHQSQ